MLQNCLDFLKPHCSCCCFFYGFLSTGSFLALILFIIEKMWCAPLNFNELEIQYSASMPHRAGRSGRKWRMQKQKRLKHILYWWGLHWDSARPALWGAEFHKEKGQESQVIMEFSLGWDHSCECVLKVLFVDCGDGMLGRYYIHLMQNFSEK